MFEVRGRTQLPALAHRSLVGLEAQVPGRMRRPKRREPALPPWDQGECGRCAAPVRVVYVDGQPVQVGMRPAPLIDRRATIAATVMDSKLVGHDRAPGTAPQSHETVWIPHDAVCAGIDRPQQLELPQEDHTQ